MAAKLEELLIESEQILQWKSTLSNTEYTRKLEGHINKINSILQKKQDLQKKSNAEGDQLKSAFLANMSHEIRTPLNGIIGFIDMLASPDLPEEKKGQYIEIIRASSSQLLTIVNDIIELAKIEANEVEIKESDFNLNNLLQNILSHFEGIAEKKKLSIELNMALTEQDSYVSGDYEKIRQITNNLLKNAIKFTHKGQIEFGYSIQNKMLVFHVKDTGVGIPKNLQNIIFERFRQADDSLSRQYGGAGLGLSISKAYVEMMNGKIWLDSIQGKGSTFYFSINYKPSSLLQQPTAQVNGNSYIDGTQEYNWKTKTILIAEDEETNFLFLEELFEESGVKIKRATNGQEAVDFIKNNNKKPDIILMDIKMPIMDGYEATRIIKQIMPDLPIVAITAYALAGDSNKALEAGCDDYLSKPINTTKLFNIISKHFKS